MTMDKIFSRRRFRIHVLKPNEKHKKWLNLKKTRKIFIIIVIAIITALLIISRINPVFNAICIEKSKAIATEIINAQSKQSFKNINYEQLVEIVKDSKRQY